MGRQLNDTCVPSCNLAVKCHSLRKKLLNYRFSKVLFYRKMLILELNEDGEEMGGGISLLAQG